MTLSNASKRTSRLAEAYQHELSHILLFDTRDPRLTGITVTRVVFTPDLSLSKIYFTALGGRVREVEIQKGFDACRGYLRRELSQRVRMKFTPELKFYYDDSEDVQKHLDQLFDQIKSDPNMSQKESEDETQES